MADDLADIRESRTTNDLLRQILGELREIRERITPPVPTDPPPLNPLPWWPVPVYPPPSPYYCWNLKTTDGTGGGK